MMMMVMMITMRKKQMMIGHQPMESNRQTTGKKNIELTHRDKHGCTGQV